ncbi:hypothetical protein EDEG_03568, partial [Edhazardia aedis USNM 41457]
MLMIICVFWFTLYIRASNNDIGLNILDDFTWHEVNFAQTDSVYTIDQYENTTSNKENPRKIFENHFCLPKEVENNIIEPVMYDIAASISEHFMSNLNFGVKNIEKVFLIEKIHMTESRNNTDLGFYVYYELKINLNKKIIFRIKKLSSNSSRLDYKYVIYNVCEICTCNILHDKLIFEDNEPTIKRRRTCVDDEFSTLEKIVINTKIDSIHTERCSTEPENNHLDHIVEPSTKRKLIIEPENIFENDEIILNCEYYSSAESELDLENIEV